MSGDLAATFRQRLETWIAPLDHADKVLVLDWVDKALESDPNADDNVTVGLIAGCIDGSFEIAGVRDGEVMFRLSAAGMSEVDDWMMNSADARRYLKSITGGAAVDEPKEPQ